MSFINLKEELKSNENILLNKDTMRLIVIILFYWVKIFNICYLYLFVEVNLQ